MLYTLYVIKLRIDWMPIWHEKCWTFKSIEKMRGQDWEFTLYPTYEKLVAQ